MFSSNEHFPPETTLNRHLVLALHVITESQYSTTEEGLLFSAESASSSTDWTTSCLPCLLSSACAGYPTFVVFVETAAS